MRISNFIINTACIPLYSKDNAFRMTEDVFRGYQKYIGLNNKVLLQAEKEPDMIIIAHEASTTTSLSDWCDSLSAQDVDFYSFIQDVLDALDILTNSEINHLYREQIIINDNTKYSSNTSLKHALYSNKALLSITNDPFWQRAGLTCRINGNPLTVVYNLYSSDISQLPFDIPPFSLFDKERFEKTQFHNKDSVIYREKDTRYLWYEDKYHENTKPHFEVFSSAGIHLGEADMSGNLDKSKADSMKRLKLQ